VSALADCIETEFLALKESGAEKFSRRGECALKNARFGFRPKEGITKDTIE
jgi:hypothetical protein